VTSIQTRSLRSPNDDAKIHARVDHQGRLIQILITPGQDLTGAKPLLANFGQAKALYRERNHVERSLNKLKEFGRIVTRDDELGASFLAFIQLAAVRISLRSIESAT
jgi:transposase